ncbi:tetratricopeptide repeat protein [Hazenella sp. IB182357]|uniref:Tetratricopeptide repeat protein n=1 Tax=Polycladospora coralii TaxID=2771432 RepID=A0A926NA31_9BACL|nr:tetratricopeptide repeat protein [Polycladospora coralii]MBD1372222.1 tetratricopeptide repeat protein [Polycladospora coralii]
MHIENLHYVGKLCKERRKALKKRQVDLVDECLSQSDISKIENGVPLSVEKYDTYMKKLQVEIKQTPTEIKEATDEQIDLCERPAFLDLVVAEHYIDFVSPSQGLKQLRGVTLSNHDRLKPYHLYLHGKYYLSKKNYTKAAKQFWLTINCVKKDEKNFMHTNFIACAYHQLSRIEYYLNRFKSAIEFSRQAEALFALDGERSYYLDFILISRVTYLKKLNRRADMQQLLNELKSKPSHPDQIVNSNSKEAILNHYEIQAYMFMESEKYKDALSLAFAGIDLARIDRMYNRSFELWTTLGNIYTKKELLQLAETCFLAALSLHRYIVDDYLFAYVYTQLGILYNKQKKGEKAKEVLLEAVQFSRRSKDSYLEAEALLILGKTYHIEGLHKKAIPLLKQGLEITEIHFYSDLQRKILIELGTIDDPDSQKYVNKFFESYVESHMN